MEVGGKKQKEWGRQKTVEISAAGDNGPQSSKCENVMTFKMQNQSIMGKVKKPF